MGDEKIARFRHDCNLSKIHLKHGDREQVRAAIERFWDGCTCLKTELDINTLSRVEFEMFEAIRRIFRTKDRPKAYEKFCSSEIGFSDRQAAIEAYDHILKLV